MNIHGLKFGDRFSRFGPSKAVHKFDNGYRAIVSKLECAENPYEITIKNSEGIIVGMPQVYLNEEQANNVLRDISKLK